MSTTSTSALRRILLAALWLSAAAVADETIVDFGGHSKTWLLADGYPEDSAFHQLTGDGAASLQQELRLNLRIDKGPWGLDAAWQIFGTWGDRVELLREASDASLPGIVFPPNDDRRLMNLTDSLYDEGKLVAPEYLLEGIDKVGQAFCDLFAGRNFGKTIVRLS